MEEYARPTTSQEQKGEQSFALPTSPQPQEGEPPFVTPAERETAPLSPANLPRHLPEAECESIAEAPPEPCAETVSDTAAGSGKYAPFTGDTRPFSELTDSDLPTYEGTRRLDIGSLATVNPVYSVQGLAAAALRDIGRVRESNQDTAFALLSTIPRGDDDLTVGLFVVADGMGGHESGDIASHLAVQTVVRSVLAHFLIPMLEDAKLEAIQDIMVNAIQEANRAIWEQAQIHHSDMGSTCTAALLLGEAIYVAHIGDSRLYLLENNQLRAITTDHSAVGRLVEIGQLTPEEARGHPMRNQLYRAIGQRPSVEVDFLYQPLGKSSHMLLCSDGLWGEVEEAQMVEALRRSPWPQDACRELIARANLMGGSDNISVVVVSLPIEEERF